MRSLSTLYSFRHPRNVAAFFTCVILCNAISLAQSNAPSLNLFNGNSLLGWNANGSWIPDHGTLQNSGAGTRSILTAMPFAEFTLQFDYNVSGSPDAALRIWTSHDNTNGLRIDLDNTGSSAGVGGIENNGRSGIASVSEGWHHALVEVAGGQVKVQIDGQSNAHVSDLGSGGGYLGFDAKNTGSLSVKNIHLTPRGFHASFNGTDLTGWKSVDSQPSNGSGVGHAMEKTLTFGLGGSSKPHGAKWNVHNGAIHGEHGPGALEGTGNYADLILHITATVKSDAFKKENFTGVLLRNPAGQLSGGYAVGIGPYAGQVRDLTKFGNSAGAAPIDETIVLAGRTVAIWSGSNLLTVYTDTRPEAQNVLQGARTSGGPISVLLPNDKESVDIQAVALATLPATYGVAAKKAPAPAPTPVPAAPAGTSAQPAPSPAEAAILQQQQATAKKDAQAQQDRQKSAALMSQALSTTDPQQQMQLYGEVVQIDPTNSAAVQGFKDAQVRVQAQQAGAQKQQTEQAAAQRDQSTREQQTSDSLNRAESSFLNGHLSEASSALSVAERLSPSNPLAHDLRGRINAAEALRARLYMLGSGVGLIGLISLILFWLRRRRQSRHPVIEIIRGLDAGQRFPLSKDKISIGAIQQDAGKKNDIVVRDVEHMISRFHCEIERRSGQLYLTDLNSSNGTYLNGERLKANAPMLLRKGAKIDLGGSVELEFTFDRDSEKKKT